MVLLCQRPTLTVILLVDSLVSCLACDNSAVTCIPVDLLYFTVSGRVLDGNSTLSQAGVCWNASLHMCFQLKGGVKYEVPGPWTCLVCIMGGCWPARQSCFSCESFRGTARQAPPGRERKYPGRGDGGPQSSSCPTLRSAKPKPRPVGLQTEPQPKAASQPTPPKLDTRNFASGVAVVGAWPGSSSAKRTWA